MSSRLFFAIILALFVVVLGACIIFARRSRKTIGKSVAWLEASIIPPIIGNLIIILSQDKVLSEIGCYIFFIGMDVIMLALMNFAAQYCKIEGKETKHRIPVFNYVILTADAVQLLLNPIFGHAFDVEEIEVEGLPYFRFVPGIGQTIHRIIDYSLLFAIIAIFVVMVIRTTRIYREKYTIILISLVVAGLWQLFYILSRTPIDSSMIGFGAFGLLVYFFSLQYRPLRLLDRMLSNIVSEMSEAIFFYGPAGKCLWMNEQAMKLTGLVYVETEAVNKKLTSMFGELRYEDKNVNFDSERGSGVYKQYYNVDKRIVFDDKGRLAGTVISIRDNTAEKQKMRRELYNSSHDRLTDLFTKEYLYERIRQLLEKGISEPYLAVFVDVKNFKIVNDIFGSKFGDHAIKSIADMLRRVVPEEGLYGRLAGDTFGIFAPKSKFDEARANARLSQFIVRMDNKEHRVLIHLGVYEATGKESDVSVMFDRAHLALSTINDQYNTHVAYYDEKLRESVVWNQKISAELDKAISDMQLRPYLQPIADKSGKVVGAEALARWIHPECGFLAPVKFIPVFEKNGMIVEVDKHMWRCACETLASWNNDMFISVNISPKDFYYTDVAAEIKALVDEYGIEPSRLRVEITESVMISDADDRMKILDEFRNAGFIVEMDDFGSGYSSLNLLKNMPVDVLKIDMMFLSKADSLDRSETIVRNIIRLSNELGIASLTEGVETPEQYRLLTEMGCNLFQGYYFSKPLPIEDFEKKYMQESEIDHFKKFRKK